MKPVRVIEGRGVPLERSDVDTVMVAGQLRKRAGKLIGVDLAKLRTEVDASRDYLLAVSGHRADLFGVAAPSKAGCVSRIATGARS